MEELTRDQITYALQTAGRHGYRRVRLSLGEVTFSATLGEAPFEADEPESDGTPSPASLVIKAGHVGYFRPGRTAVEAGDTVQLGDVVGEITALGIANDVVAQVGGKVTEVKVNAGDAVEFGQPLFVLEAP